MINSQDKIGMIIIHYKQSNKYIDPAVHQNGTDLSEFRLKGKYPPNPVRLWHEVQRTNHSTLVANIQDIPMPVIVCLKRYRIVIFPQQNGAETIIGWVCSD